MRETLGECVSARQIQWFHSAKCKNVCILGWFGYETIVILSTLANNVFVCFVCCYEKIASGANFSECFAFSVFDYVYGARVKWTSSHVFDAHCKQQQKQLLFGFLFKCKSIKRVDRMGTIFMTSCAKHLPLYIKMRCLNWYRWCGLNYEIKSIHVFKTLIFTSIS